MRLCAASNSSRSSKRTCEASRSAKRDSMAASVDSVASADEKAPASARSSACSFRVAGPRQRHQNAALLDAEMRIEFGGEALDDASRQRRHIPAWPDSAACRAARASFSAPWCSRDRSCNCGMAFHRRGCIPPTSISRTPSAPARRAGWWRSRARSAPGAARGSFRDCRRPARASWRRRAGSRRGFEAAVGEQQRECGRSAVAPGSRVTIGR
jgi:hypothetical protein